MAVPLIACMALVASIYNLPPRVLPSIHVVEGGGIGTVHLNADGSQDLGYMQVNSRWLPKLAEYSKLPESSVRQNLLSRPCFNVAAAGYIMRRYLDETRNDLMRAVGDYHSHTPQLNAAYRELVTRSAAELFGAARGG